MAAKKDEYGNLIEPEMPVAIDNTAVQKANQGVTAAKGALDAMSYDNFKQGSMYGGLKKSYSQQGQQAMKDTIGQVAARTGGMASSWAATAGQQSYNNYMQQLEDVARSMYNDEYSKARDKVNLAQGEYDRAYGEYRDKISDDRYNTEQSQKLQEKEEEQAQADCIAIWATGGTPTAEQLAAAGWGDESAGASEDGTIPAGLSALGQAYYKQATAAPEEEEPEFRGVSATEFEQYSEYFNSLTTQEDAINARDAILAATGNEDFAFTLYEMWLNNHSEDDKIKLPEIVLPRDPKLEKWRYSAIR